MEDVRQSCDAGPSIKQAADAVTTGVDADGLALVLELLL